MEEYITFLEFQDIETASIYTSILEKHNLPFELINNNAQLRLIATDNQWESAFVLKIKDSDFERARQYFDTEIEK